jgi:TRAP-type mannitol/chloroaromatic compound transport system permease small subunit
MSDHAVREDDSTLSRLDQGLHRIERWLNLAAGILVLFIVLFSVINIVGRGAFNRPFNAYFDLMGQSVPLIAFFGLAFCQRVGGHIRMDLFIGQIKGRLLWVIEAILTLLMMLTIAALSWGAWSHTVRAWTKGDSTEDINMPLWPIKGALFVMFVLLEARLTLQFVAYLRAIVTGEDRPIAIPVIETPAKQAEREAASVSGMEGR